MRRTVGPNFKILPKIGFQKFVKMTNHLCLRQFWQILYMKGNQSTKIMGISRNLKGKTHEITLRELIFGRVFNIWNHCALVHRKEIKWSQPKAFPGTIPSWSPCIIAINLSVVGSGPMWIPGKSRSKRYLINVVLPKTNDRGNQSVSYSSNEIVSDKIVESFYSVK